jgi:hypothetical protein
MYIINYSYLFVCTGYHILNCFTFLQFSFPKASSVLRIYHPLSIVYTVMVLVVHIVLPHVMDPTKTLIICMMSQTKLHLWNCIKDA